MNEYKSIVVVVVVVVTGSRGVSSGELKRGGPGPVSPVRGRPELFAAFFAVFGGIRWWVPEVAAVAASPASLVGGPGDAAFRLPKVQFTDCQGMRPP